MTTPAPLTDAELDELERLLPHEAHMAVLRALSRCAAAEAELAQLRAAIDEHFPDDGFSSEELSREGLVAAYAGALKKFRSMALDEFPRICGEELASLRSELDAAREEIARLDSALGEADAELELYHPDRGGKSR